MADGVEALSEPDLRERLSAVLAGGDRASMFAYPMAGEKRAKELAGAGRHGGANPELSADLRKLRRGLMDRGRLLGIVAADEQLKPAREAKELVWRLQRGGRTAGEVYRRRAYGNLAQRVGQAG